MKYIYRTDAAAMARWIRTPRTAQSPAEYAEAISHDEDVRRIGERSDAAIIIIAVVFAVMLVATCVVAP